MESALPCCYMIVSESAPAHHLYTGSFAISNERFSLRDWVEQRRREGGSS
jgi:hypothetical protein